MKCKLLQKWFIRDIPYDSFGRVFVGRLYRKGIHEIPDDLKEQMPRKIDGNIVDWIEFTDDNGKTWYKDYNKVAREDEEEEDDTPNTLSGIAKKNWELDPLRKKLAEAEAASDKMAKVRVAKIKKQIEEKENK